MSKIERNITLKLSNIENELIDLLDLIDYKQLCEEKLGHTLDNKIVAQFIKKYNKHECNLCEIDFDRDDTSISAILTGTFSFCLALFSCLFCQSSFLFVFIILMGVFGARFFKKKQARECDIKEAQECSKWEAYKQTLPFDKTTMSLMEKIIHNKKDFEPLSEFYKVLYLFLKDKY